MDGALALVEVLAVSDNIRASIAKRTNVANLTCVAYFFSIFLAPFRKRIWIDCSYG